MTFLRNIVIDPDTASVETETRLRISVPVPPDTWMMLMERTRKQVRFRGRVYDRKILLVNSTELLVAIQTEVEFIGSSGG